MSHVKYLLLFVTSDHVDYKCTLIFTVDLSQDGDTALHVACQEGHDLVVELLLQAGASVDPKTEVRCGPLPIFKICSHSGCLYLWCAYVYEVLVNNSSGVQVCGNKLAVICVRPRGSFSTNSCPMVVAFLEPEIVSNRLIAANSHPPK